MEISFQEYDLNLRNTFKTAHSERNVQKSVIVTLLQDGITGYGETTVNTYFGITLEMILSDLRKVASALTDYNLTTPEELHNYLRNTLGIHNFPLCAIDEAAYDWFGKMHNQATHIYLGQSGLPIPKTDFTIGIDSVEKMVSKMKNYPWPLYKIKLGTEDDIRIVAALRATSDALFRVDANCGWSVAETIENSKKLVKMGVEFIEQPLPPEDIEGMAEVYKRAALPIIADESCQVEEDVAKCANLFHGINIKLTKCGGLTSARKMVEEARSLSMKVMAGCMTESSVGISALCQLAPLLDYLDADGTLLITNDPASGVKFDFGEIIYADVPGNGITLN